MSVINRRNCFDNDWYFSLTDNEDAKVFLFNHLNWEKVTLPHDWSVKLGFDKYSNTGKQEGFIPAGVGYYRKSFYINETMLNKKLFIEFDGVYMNSEVYLNGKLLGKRPYGYISFSYEITEYIQKGLNIFSVRVDNKDQPSSRWYNGSGICRHVWLTCTDNIYTKQWGTYIKTPYVSDNYAQIDMQLAVISTLNTTQTVDIINEFYDNYNNLCAENKITKILCTGENDININVNIQNPKLWSIENPNLYYCITEIVYKNSIIDSYKTRFGIRNTEFIKDKGFFLNGENIKFKGVCNHHDAGIVGAAVPDKLLKKRLLMLKEMGCNAIRTTHNPFAPEFYDLCDELGLMVMDEIFDGWETVKAPFGYGLFFEEWHRKDLEDFIKRDRNHPSVVMWSIGNEVHKMKVNTTVRLKNLVKSLDDTRPVTCGIQGTGKDSDDNRAVLDIAGYNDGGGACFIYERDHKKRPDQLMIATEAPHSYHTRGFYRTQTWWRDKNQPRIEIENLCEEELFFDGHLSYNSSYDNSGVRTCARDSWSLAEKYPYLMGEFRWTGFDYYGESFGWPSRFTANGVIDVANIKKDHFYLYQSMWTKEPMIHLLPHWTHNNIEKGTKIPVWVYTNCEEAQLFLNGVSMGSKTKGNAKHLQWDVPYTEGELIAIGYINGVEMAKKGYKTAGVPYQIMLESDSENLCCDGIDTSQITFTICDKAGVSVPYADNSVEFIAVGSGEIIGTENGNSLDLTPLTSSKRAAFYGMGTAMVRAKKCDGDICVYAVSILGDTIFKVKTSINIDVKKIVFKGKNLNDIFDIQISINNGVFSKFTGSFEISETSKIAVKILRNSELFAELEEIFVKGERDKVIDLAHSNKDLNLDKPVGPFSEKLFGIWSDGSFTYSFKETGEFTRILSSNEEQLIGYWWYDFPVDFFEAQDYAGTGEIWFVSGEKNKMYMPSQMANEIVIENDNGAIGSAYGHSQTITLKKLQSVNEIV